jgi:diacylglycerol kinase (ATP)
MTQAPDAAPAAGSTSMTPMSPHKGKTGLVRIWNALFYSLSGLRSAYKNESAFRQELFLAALLPIAPTQRAILIGSILLVFISELLNSAVEAVVDRVSTEHHELAKRAKDMGSAAVFVSLVNCVVLWGLVLWETFAQ